MEVVGRQLARDISHLSPEETNRLARLCHHDGLYVLFPELLEPTRSKELFISRHLQTVLEHLSTEQS